MSSTFFHSIISAMFLISIVGCGEGSSGASPELSPEPQEAESPGTPSQEELNEEELTEEESTDERASEETVYTVSLDREFVQTDESRVYQISGQFLAPDSLMLTQSPDIGLETISSQDNQILLEIPDVDRPSQADLQLTFIYGDQSVVQNLSLLVNNTSAASLVQQIENTLSEKNSILGLAQDFALYRFFIDYAYLNGLLTHSQKNEYLGEFSPLDLESSSSARSAINELESAFELYQQANLSDTNLRQSLELVAQSVREHGLYGSQMLRDIQPFVEVLVPELGSGDLTYVPEAGIYSRFLSTPVYGELTETGFSVAELYEPIESLIRTRKTQSMMCESP